MRRAAALALVGCALGAAPPSDADDGARILDLSRIDALDATALDARGDGLPVRRGPVTVVAHEVLAGLLAWEARRGIGDGAFAAPVTAASTSTPPGTGEPLVGAALAAPSGLPERRDRRDALDLAFEGPPLTIEAVTVDSPGLSFERRTLYQATTGRLFVDFRLRHRDPVHGMAALDAEARTAEAVRRMRTLSTMVIGPTGAATCAAAD